MSEYVFRYAHGFGGELDECDNTDNVDHFGTLHEEIVRCRDCDFSHEGELGDLRCHGPLTDPWDYYNDEPSDGVKVEPSGFCSWGKRRNQ